LSGGASVTHPIDPHWPGNVLDLLLAQILKDKGQPVARVVVDRIGDKYPTGIGQGFDPCGDVNAVAIEVVAFDDHVAEIDADAQLDPAGRRDAHVPLGHCLRHRDHAAHRIDDAHKFHQHAVAGGLDDAAMMFADFRIRSSRRIALRRSSVPSSSAPISREYPPHRRQGPRRDVGSQSSLPPRLAQTFEQVASSDRYHGHPRTYMSNAAGATAIGFLAPPSLLRSGRTVRALRGESG
jgi:hypothetical protein